MTAGDAPARAVQRSYLALGSNLGDRAEHLQHAVDALGAHRGTVVVGISKVYATAPVGGPDQDEYLNAVVAVDTTCSPHELLDLAHEIEQSANRVRTVRWGPRTLDVDLLLYDDLVLDDSDLTIPHPRMWERDFVLIPLRDLAPERVTKLAAGGAGVHDAGVALKSPPK